MTLFEACFVLGLPLAVLAFGGGAYWWSRQMEKAVHRPKPSPRRPF